MFTGKKSTPEIIKTFLTLAFLLLILIPLGVAPAQAQEDLPLALVLSVDGPLTPSWKEYLERGLQLADQRGADLVVFEINTPGGSVNLMQELVAMMRGSPVPIIVYVTPRGAMAASAGTVITLAGHAAAMAPETIIGAASPVGAQGEELGETIQAKEKNALKAQVRTLAAGRGPDAIALAESTIEEATAVSAQEALDVGLIDFIAEDLHDLLHQLDGYTVETTAGGLTLDTANAEVSSLNLSFIEQLLAVLTNPNIVFILLTIGVQAILIEISSPGGWVAGFIGVVCLSLAVYGFGVLPVNWFGLSFLVTAFVLFAIFTFWPIFFTAYLSFTDWNMIRTTRNLVGLDNYRKLFADPLFFKVVRTTLIFAFATVFVRLAISLGLALLLNEKLPGQYLFRGLVFSPHVTTTAAAAMVFTFVFDPNFGLLKAVLSVFNIRSPRWLMVRT